MPYSIKQLADIAHVSVRTLHFYDEIGLLAPSSIKGNGYRTYEEKELLRLQQILFFRELELSLDQIKSILDAKGFDVLEALKSRKKLIEIKEKRLRGLSATIDKTISKIKHTTHMDDKELYGSFTKEEIEKYQEEARQKWGHTDAYKQSAERVKKMGKDALAKIAKEQAEIPKAIALRMDNGVADAGVQALIAQWATLINKFYDAKPAMLRNLGAMYVGDARFTAYYEKYRTGLAQFMKEAIDYYCDQLEK